MIVRPMQVASFSFAPLPAISYRTSFRNTQKTHSKSQNSRWIKTNASETLPYLVVLECDGVVTDLHTNGHRVAFNEAFKELGFDCANWTPSIYHDLIRLGDGTEESLIQTYFDKTSWPSTVARSDYKALAKNIIAIKKRFLATMLQEGSVPLRWGVVEFVDTCLENDVVVSILTRTQSDRADDVWNGLKPLFGEDRAARVKEIAWPQSSKTSDEMEETLNEKIREEKRRIADVFISFMNERRRNKQYELEMDANLQRSRKPNVDASFFLSMAVASGSSVRRCALIGAFNSILQDAAAAGVFTIAIPASFAQRLSFPSAMARFDGLGAGGLSWPRLESLLAKERNLY